MKVSYLVGFAAALVACGGGSNNDVNHIPDGGTGETVLTSTTIEPAGSNCEYGGTKVEVGVDKNGNGILDADEVQSTFYICDQAPPPSPQVFYGELYIGSAGDVAAAQAYTGVIGDVIIQQDNDTTTLDVSLPNLTFISGQLTDCSNVNQAGNVIARAHAPAAAQPSNATVELAALATVGSIDIGCGLVSSVSLAGLTAIHGGLDLFGQTVATWSAPVLKTIEQSVYISGTSLAALALPPPGTEPGASLTIQDNLSLSDCAMDDLAGALRRAGFRGAIYVANNGDGTNDGSNSTCSDASHACQAVTIGGDSTNWRECEQAVEFTAARSMCQAIGTGWDLAYLTSIAEEQSIGALQYDPTFWIGYWQATASAPYTWVQAPVNQTFAPQSSSDPTYGAFWNAGEPTGDANPDCVQIFPSDSLNPASVVANDIYCTNGYQPLCRHLP